MQKTLIVLAAGLALIIALSACQISPVSVTPETPEPETETSTSQPVGMANPASQNCIDNGGTLEIRNRKAGEYGVCLFDDNRQCEEWALLRGQCPMGGLKITGYENDAQVYCAITGGQV
ncbi:MAG: DUF333 domain-containing protein [Patescibacteria group bacterium]